MTDSTFLLCPASNLSKFSKQPPRLNSRSQGENGQSPAGKTSKLRKKVGFPTPIPFSSPHKQSLLLFYSLQELKQYIHSVSGFYMQASMQDPTLDDSAPVTDKWQFFSHLLMSHASLFPHPTACPQIHGFSFLRC